MFLASKFAICTALSEPILRIRTIETLSFSIVLHKITGFAGHNNENKMKMSEFGVRLPHFWDHDLGSRGICFIASFQTYSYRRTKNVEYKSVGSKYSILDLIAKV